MKQIALTAEVKRKASNLPRYVVILEDDLASWHLAGTTELEVSINDKLQVRRNIIRWGKGKDWWFIGLSESICRQAGIDTGDTIRLSLSLATTELPTELQELISNNDAAHSVWEQKTPGQQRMLKDYILAAKQSATRARRARKVLQIES